LGSSHNEPPERLGGGGSYLEVFSGTLSDGSGTEYILGVAEQKTLALDLRCAECGRSPRVDQSGGPVLTAI
jgi:hypothetical protein